MSILIKGMMMPVNCQTCPFVQRELDEETPVEINLRCGFTQKVADNPAFERNNNCPLVEIPPHGRLIDADALHEELNNDCEDAFRRKAISSWEGWLETMDALSKAPTIIEAEEEKE